MISTWPLSFRGSFVPYSYLSSISQREKKIRRAVLVVVFLKIGPFVFDMTTLLHLVGLIASSVGNVVNNTLGQMPG